MKEVLIKHLKTHWSVKLNRPDKRNAFNPKMIQDLTEFFKTADVDHEARFIHLSGAGQSFCAGADLEWMKSMAKYKLKENEEDAHKLFEMFEAAKNCPLPIVGEVHGNVFGGGLGLVAVCDIVVAEAATTFCFSETKLGLAPAVISSFVLRKMRPNKAREFMMTAQAFDSKAALDSGLIEYVGRELEVRSLLMKIFKQIGSIGPEAVRETKKLLEFHRYASASDSKKQSIQTIAQMRMSKEGQEGMTSFFEKRKPNWTLQESFDDEEE